jgi:hypothetical protein
MKAIDKGPHVERSGPVLDAQAAIWRLFEEGYLDEDMATAGLLAVDLGQRRSQQTAPERAGQRLSWARARRAA